MLELQDVPTAWGIDNRRAVRAYHRDGTECGFFESLVQAGRHVGRKPALIGRAAKTRGFSGGFWWKFDGDDEPINLNLRGFLVKAVLRDGTEVERFVSIKAAAQWADVYPSSVRAALAKGTRSGGYWWRYSDMPDSCQPLKPPAKRTPVLVDGKLYPSIYAASGGRGSKWMRIKRSLQAAGAI